MSCGDCLIVSAGLMLDRGWVKQLEGRGWFKEVPTLWLAEGLLMYLDQAASDNLLRDMAGM